MLVLGIKVARRGALTPTFIMNFIIEILRRNLGLAAHVRDRSLKTCNRGSSMHSTVVYGGRQSMVLTFIVSLLLILNFCFFRKLRIISDREISIDFRCNSDLNWSLSVNTGLYFEILAEL